MTSTPPDHVAQSLLETAPPRPVWHLIELFRQFLVVSRIARRGHHLRRKGVLLRQTIVQESVGSVDFDTFVASLSSCRSRGCILNAISE